MTWLPGQSGNPEGGRAGKPIRDAVRLELKMMEQGREDRIPALCARSMVRAMIKRACEGDVAAFNAISDRCDGKPKVEIGGSDEPILLALSRAEDARERIAAGLSRIASANVVPGLIEGKTDSKD